MAGLSAVGGALALNHYLVGIFYDDGLYAALAWALAHGRGFVYPNLPGAPSAVHYPPLYPVVLAPLFGLLSVPAAAVVGKVLNVGFAAVAWGLTAWHSVRAQLLGDAAPPGLAGATIAAAALAIPCLTVLTVLLSEPLFALLFVVAVIFADRPPARLSTSAAAVLAGVGAALALLVRSIGVAVGAGVVVWLYTTGRAAARVQSWRLAGLAATPLVLAGLGWGAWIVTHRAAIDPLLGPDYGSYFEIVRSAGVGALGATATDLGRPLGVLALNWTRSRAVYFVCGVPMLGVWVYGLALLARRSAAGLALILYLAILACWPVPPDRFLWALLPWLALAWTCGAVGLWRRARLRVPVAILTVALVVGYTRYEVRGFAGRWWTLAAQRISDTFAGILPALDSLPPAAVVATDHDPLVWLYTHRAAVPLYIFGYRGHVVLEPPAAVHRAYLERQGVTHVLLAGPDADGAEELQRLIVAYPRWLVPIRRWPGGKALFEVRREP